MALLFSTDIEVTGPAPDDIINPGSLVVLQCRLFGAIGAIAYKWAREDGLSLPQGSFQDNNGE